MEFRRTPSELIDLPRHLQREYGYNEWFVCSQFDEAVMIIGNVIEGKTYERDDEGKTLYTVADILDGALVVPEKEIEVTKLSRDSSLIRPKPQVNPNL